jgi:hypothetical protein
VRLVRKVSRKLGHILEAALLGELNPIDMVVVWLMKPIERLIRRRTRPPEDQTPSTANPTARAASEG